MTAKEFLNNVKHKSEINNIPYYHPTTIKKAMNDFANYRISEIKKQILNEIVDNIEYLQTSELDEFECITIENLEGILNNIK